MIGPALNVLKGVAKFALRNPIGATGAGYALDRSLGGTTDLPRAFADYGAFALGLPAYAGVQAFLGRDDGVATGTLDEAIERGLAKPSDKPGPRKVSYPVAGDPIYQAQNPTPQDPLPAPPADALLPTESVPGAPPAPVLPPPLDPGYKRDYAEETTGLLGQLNAMEKENMDKLGMSYQALEESDALLDKMIKEKKK